VSLPCQVRRRSQALRRLLVRGADVLGAASGVVPGLRGPLGRPCSATRRSATRRSSQWSNGTPVDRPQSARLRSPLRPPPLPAQTPTMITNVRLTGLRPSPTKHAFGGLPTRSANWGRITQGPVARVTDHRHPLHQLHDDHDTKCLVQVRCVWSEPRPGYAQWR
jgi:hypothetical protein